jgi:hypothetical protein
MPIEREQITPEQITAFMKYLNDYLDGRIAAKGFGAFVNIFEGYGVLAEESYELLQAIHQNNSAKVCDELMDVIIAAIWTRLSMKMGGVDYKYVVGS